MPHTIESYHKEREILLWMFGHKCAHCGVSEKLEFHHISGNGEHGVGGWKQLYSVRVNMADNNIMVLCPDCHRAIHKRDKNAL
jgi:hypothetical protein